MKIRAVVIGYGSRGAAYSSYAAKYPEKLEITAVADLLENRRKYAQKLHNIPDDRVFTDWRELKKQPKMADFAIIATQDSQHLEPAIAMIEKGYNLLLEKPMATTPADCKRNGRCVYDCDNDVVDNQTVNMEFEDGTTATLTMNAFGQGGRYVRAFGTKGEVFMISGDEFVVYSFASRTERRVKVTASGNTIADGHGGGDMGIMVDAVKYFGEGIASKSICDVRMSYISHLIAFAAEQSRLTDTVIDLDDFSDFISVS